jgi:DNA-binding Xre family transcriptional regulator
MTRKITKNSQRLLGYDWHLRQLMAKAEMFSTTDLIPLLAERGIELSAAQVYRLVTGTPERLSLRTLVALCDILHCSPNDLIEPVAETQTALTATSRSRAGSGQDAGTGLKNRTPRRAEISRKT